MEAVVAWKLKDGRMYDKYFPKADYTNVVIEKNADLGDTMRFIPHAVRATLSDTLALSRQVLLGRSLYETCRKVWHFIKEHIAYKPDRAGVEQIRRPARLWWDKIGDCDCFTVFISSVLTNLGIYHKLRVTQYDPLKGFQHIYPIVPRPGGGYYTIDCVVNEFNYEEPFDINEDHNMELHYLNGVPENGTPPNKDADFLFAGSQEVGKLNIFQKVKQVASKAKTGVKNIAVKVKEKGLHVINRANPATVLLRAGVLASMKLNVFGVAEKLRWSYLSDQEAAKRGIIPEKFAQLKKIREKLEKIFFDAGGKPENLKESILTGKGNQDRKVVLSGLGRVTTNVRAAQSLAEILGEDIYNAEVHNKSSLGSLGEPVTTAAALASSTGAMGIIAGLLKAIGNIFRKITGKEGATSEEVTDENAETYTDGSTETETTEYSPEEFSETTETTTDESTQREGDEPGFFGKVKNWISENKTTAVIIGSTVVAAGVGGYYLYTRRQKSLSGVSRKGKRGRKKGKRDKGAAFKMQSLS